MRVGLVCPYDLSLPGGVQAQVLGLARSLAAIGVEPLVAGPGLPDGVPGTDLGVSLGIPGNGSVAPVGADPRLFRRLRGFASGVDVLHVHEPLMPPVSVAALRSGPPVVATFHAAPGRVVMGVYRVLGKRLTMALGEMVRVVTAVSPVAAEPIRGSTEPLIIPNGVDTASLRVDVDRVSTRVSFLGRDEPRKGLDVLLKAWPAVVERFGDAELVVMGVEREDAGVRFMGRVDDATKAEVLSSSAVYVAPNTHGESFGITLVEGMASGAAVLASDLPAFTYVGRDGARYFETGSASSLAATLIELLTDNAMRDSVASRGVERARAFDWSFVATAYKETYLRAIS